ncbi:hypothetical protein SAMN04488134_11517 [Amphibacillus marinus]|uniref:Streptomycin adenylyltransferase n=1 Tax=Amphibacillus marinus TaxID=872970 RepID=A0A1H8T893_9BACI|nr:hypothetical protein [Amphibacillus marinus]SEO87122.1 hypothetical protein SAMN04488134_11517 [Amphibacillus marinus]
MGLGTKHGIRDLALPKSRNLIIKAINEDLLQDPNILGLFYGGSIGNDTTDLYSDIDLRLIIADAFYESYRLNKKQRATNWGEVLFFEDVPSASYSTAHFKTFVKVDTFYYQTRDIHPSIWLKNIKIIHDTNGFLATALEKSKLLSYELREDKFEMWRSKFFAYLHEGYRRLKRKENYYALQCLDRMRLLMVAGWYMDAGIEPNSPTDWAKLEGERSQLLDWQLELLTHWDSGRDARQITCVIQSIIPEFRHVQQKLSDKLNLAENPNDIDEIIKLVF